MESKSSLKVAFLNINKKKKVGIVFENCLSTVYLVIILLTF